MPRKKTISIVTSRKNPKMIVRERKKTIWSRFSKYNSLPTIIQLHEMLKAAKTQGIRRYHIATKKKGKLIGIVSFYIGIELMTALKQKQSNATKITELIKNFIPKENGMTKQQLNIAQLELIEKLKKEGLQMKIVTMPKYEFDGTNFKKKKT